MMKRSLPIFISLLVFISAQQSSAQRYLSEVFSSVNITYGKAYGANYSFLISPSAPYVDSLRMDVYQPAGDTLSARPMIIYLHTGSFLPVIQNGNPTGYRGDSATVEMCKEFARRGYVAVSMSYRAGWNPLSSDQDTRTGSLLQAVYRALQDAKTCVRYFKMNAKLQGNTFKIDTSKIVLGGQGSGGYVALAYATLHNNSQITLEKFIAGSNANPIYHWGANSPYVDQSVWGDFEGIGGDPNLNLTNWPGYSTGVQMVFNMGGALGDSSWIEPGMAPMVCFHVTNDPFAPYGFGDVIVPFFNYFVVSVAGSREVVRIANEKGNNDVFNIAYNDPYTTRANQVNEGFEGLFPFVLPDPSIFIPSDPYHGQAGPWEWWDSTDLQNFAPYVLATADQATTAYLSGFYTNPDMSKNKGMAYIDSMQGYLAPRMVAALALPVGIDEAQPGDMLIHSFPNPASDHFTIRMQDPTHQMQFIQICDPSGRVLKELQNIHGSEVQVNRERLSAGLYLLRIGVDDRIIQGKMIFQ